MNEHLALFTDLREGERFFLSLDDHLTRERTGLTMRLASLMATTFSRVKFNTIHDWFLAVNAALSLSGWELAWHQQSWQEPLGWDQDNGRRIMGKWVNIPYSPMYKRPRSPTRQRLEPQLPHSSATRLTPQARRLSHRP